MSKIYPLCDFELLKKYNLTIDRYLKKLYDLDVIMLQYRDKVNSLDIQKRNLLFLKKNLDIPIIINDKIELVEYCDGVHLGQEDIDKLTNNRKKFIDNFKKKYNKIIGLSTHNLDEIMQANDYSLDYIGLGAYKSSSTKKDISAILGKKVEELAPYSIHKVAVIGGVNLDDNIKNIDYLVIGSGICQI